MNRKATYLHPNAATALRRAAGRAVVPVLLAASLPACINDDDACPADVPAADTPVMLSLQISVPASATTRAGGHTIDDSDHHLEAATDAENFVNFEGEDYQILLFDGNGTYIDQFTPIWTFSWQDAPAGSSDNTHTGLYTTTLSGPLPESVSSTAIQVLVLANWLGDTNERTWGSGIAYPDWKTTPPTTAPTLTDLYTNATDYNFTMPYITGSDGTISTWRPSVAEVAEDDNHTHTGVGIPMFGLSDRIEISRLTADEESQLKEDLDDFDDDAQHYALRAEIQMLRALAKIEVIDAIDANADGTTAGNNGSVRVSDVTLTSCAATGRFIPDLSLLPANGSWNDATIQVAAPSLPEDPAGDALSNLKFFQIPATDGENARWIAYVPEMALPIPSDADDAATVAASRPHLDVDIQTEGSTTSTTYTVEFADYTDGLATTPYAALLRNHIYRYTINSVNGAIELEVEVEDWTEETGDGIWNFTDNIVIAESGLLEWANYQSLDRATVTVRQGTDLADLLTGRFTISSPVGAMWRASLITTSGRDDAFYFTDAKGNPLESNPTGIIDGNVASIHIRNNSATVQDVANEAKLVIMVVIGDEATGRWIEADVCKKGEATNYIIHQNPTSL